MKKILTSALAILTFAVTAQAQPTIAWQPSSISQTMFPGTQTFVAAQLVSQVAAKNMSLRVVPQLAPYVSVTPNSIASLAANTPVRIDVIFTLSAFTAPGQLTGTVQVLTDAGGVKPLPLPITLSILQPTAGFIPSFISAASPDRVQVDSTSGALYAANEVDVIFRSGTSIDTIRSLISQLPETFIGSNPTSRYFQILVSLQTASSLDALVSQLESNATVALAMRHWFLENATTPREWNVLAPDQTYGYRVVGLPEVWSNQIAEQSRGVAVAILDNGFDAAHPDLFPNVTLADLTFVERHGTEVAGILGAVENALGVAGVLWLGHLTLYPAAGTAVENDRDGHNWDTALVEKALSDALFTGNTPKILNVSGDSKPGDPDFAQMKTYFSTKLAEARLKRKQILLVAAAGNQGRIFSPNYPAGLAAPQKRFCNVLSVAASDGPSTDRIPMLWPGSNFGLGISVAAPGAAIYTTSPNAGYGTDSGTSMSAPFVSGVAALLLAKEHNSLSEFQLRDLVIEGSRLEGSQVRTTGGEPAIGDFFVLSAPGSFRLADKLKGFDAAAQTFERQSALIDFKAFNNGLATVHTVDVSAGTVGVDVLFSTNVGTESPVLQSVTGPILAGNSPHVLCTEPNHLLRLAPDTEVVRGLPGLAEASLPVSALTPGDLVFVEIQMLNSTTGANVFLDSHRSSPSVAPQGSPPGPEGVLARRLYVVPR